MLVSINPATGKEIARYGEHTPEEINAIIERTAEAQRTWATLSFADRAKKVAGLAFLLRRESDRLATLITREMGKPIGQSHSEIEKCAGVCDYYARHAAGFLANEPVPTEASRSYISYRPLGVVLAVMPWNFPFWQVFRFAAPALMAGNSILLKHASNVTGCALAIEYLCSEAGLPENLLRTVKVPGKKAGDIIGNQHVRAVTLTGSVGAGRAIASKAGSMLKKSVLELGGSDPYIVLEDADLENAVRVCTDSRLINSGQSCISAKRFIVVAPLLQRFTERFVEEMASRRMGDPLDNATDVGPQASTALRDELHLQVTASIQKGARCLLGGTVPEKDGAWYPPTVLADVAPGMPAYDEEIFGPVAAIIGAKSEPDAIRIANDTVFGLGAAVFTSHADRGGHIAEKLLDAGCCFVNEMVRSDPRLPFGGIGDSGYGRELSYIGIREFTNTKTVYVK